MNLPRQCTESSIEKCVPENFLFLEKTKFQIFEKPRK